MKVWQLVKILNQIRNQEQNVIFVEPYDEPLIWYIGGAKPACHTNKLDGSWIAEDYPEIAENKKNYCVLTLE